MDCDQSSLSFDVIWTIFHRSLYMVIGDTVYVTIYIFTTNLYFIKAKAQNNIDLSMWSLISILFLNCCDKNCRTDAERYVQCMYVSDMCIYVCGFKDVVTERWVNGSITSYNTVCVLKFMYRNIIIKITLCITRCTKR